MGVEKSGFSSDQSGSHLLHVSIWEGSVLDGGNTDLSQSGVEHLALRVSWVVVEDGVSSANDALNELSETDISDVVFSLQALVWLLLGEVSLVSLPVDSAVDLLAAVEDVGNSNFVLSQSSGLVRADARGGSKSLDGFEVLDEHHLLGHSLGSESEGHSDSGEKTFWDVGDNDTDGEDHVGDERVLVDNSEDEEEDSQEHSDGRDDLDESFNLNGQRSWLGLSRGSKVSNLTNDGVVSGLEAESNTRASSALSSEESNVFGLENVGGWLEIWVDFNVHHLSGEGSVVDLHLVGSDDHDVAWNVLSTFDLNKVSWNDVLGVNLLLLSVSDDVG